MQHCAQSGSPASLDSIVEYTAREYYQPVFGEPLETAQTIELCRLLHEHGADLDTRDPDSGHSALTTAISRGDLDLARWLLEHDVNVDTNAPVDRNPLEIARRLGFGQLEQSIREATSS